MTAYMIYETNLEGLSLARSLKQLDCVEDRDYNPHTVTHDFIYEKMKMAWVLFFFKKNITFFNFFHITKQIK